MVLALRSGKQQTAPTSRQGPPLTRGLGPCRTLQRPHPQQLHSGRGRCRGTGRTPPSTAQGASPCSSPSRPSPTASCCPVGYSDVKIH